MKKNIAVLASGKGSNAKNICSFFQNSKDVTIKLICSNKKNSPLFSFSKENSIGFYYLDTSVSSFFDDFIQHLQLMNIDFIVLSGFLLKIPKNLVELYKNKIINIHPSLLPKYGGKGMYGNHVHKAVLAQGESETGITIHYVNEHYDEGKIIQQFSTSITEAETLDSLLLKIKALEKAHFPPTIEKAINEQLKIEREKENQ